MPAGAKSCLLPRLIGMRVFAVLVTVAFLGASCSGSDDDTPVVVCDSTPVATPVPEGYGGLLFDAHAHLDDPALVEALACSMRHAEVEAAVVHAFMDPTDPVASEGDYLTVTRDRDVRFIPAFHVAPTTPEAFDARRVRAVLNQAGLLLVGVGEVDFHVPPWAGTSLAAEPWPGLFELADERDLFLVVDLRADQADELDRMLERFPDTKVLVIGGALRAALPDLLREHDNLFVAITAPALLPIDAAEPRRFVERFDDRWEQLLSVAVDDWLPVVQAGPGRVMWGSDAAEAWQGEAEVYGRVTAFTRAFPSPAPHAGPLSPTPAASSESPPLPSPTPERPCVCIWWRNPPPDAHTGLGVSRSSGG